jgi:hypothetical protein
MGRHRCLTITADAVTRTQAKEYIRQFIVLPAGNPERGNQRRPYYRRPGIFYDKRYAFHMLFLLPTLAPHRLTIDCPGTWQSFITLQPIVVKVIKVP